MPGVNVTIDVAAVVVGERFRKELLHMPNLVHSISKLGLLHPIVVNSRNELIAGRRRLEAVKRLGWGTVPARRIDTLDDAVAALTAERDENTCREPLSLTEMVELGKRIEELEKPRAAAREKAGKKAAKEPSGNLPEGAKGDTRDKVAAALGVSGKTYEKAKKVVAAAEREPEKFAPVVAEMDRTGKVEPAYRQVETAAKPAPPEKPRPDPADVARAVELLTTVLRLIEQMGLTDVAGSMVDAAIRALKELARREGK